MDFVILFFFTLAAADNNSPTSYCAGDSEWDPIQKQCIFCPNETIYDKHTSKCLKKTGKNQECQKGFYFDFLENNCVDIDECNLGKSPCGPKEYCVNEEGSYMCKLKNFCGQGYQVDSSTQTCKDINECEKPVDYCGVNMLCENIPGSFICRRPCPNDKTFYWNGECHVCQEGFQFNRNTKVCEDVDECEGPYRLTCSPYKEKCVKMPVLSKCISHCSGGTKEKNGICYDIDECITKTHNCSRDKKCENLFGTFQCETPKCNMDAIFNPDINSCVCKDGFKINQLSGECEDVNECLDNPTPCGPNGLCIKNPGRFTCKCNIGYHFKNGTCQDLNECTSKEGICGNLLCENMLGGYKCVCPVGFRNNGFEGCEDVNECFESPEICNANNLAFDGEYQCFNLIGAFKCIKTQCPTEYRTIKDNNNIICELLDSNCSFENNQICLQPLPKTIFFHIIQIPKIIEIPHKLANVRISIPMFNDYQVQIVVRKAIDSKTKKNLNFNNGIMMTHDNYNEDASIFLSKILINATEIICDVYLKYNLGSQEIIHSLNQYHIFANNDSL